MEPRKIKVAIFSSFEDENRAEHHRLAKMSHEERLHEFSILQERQWGKDWTSKPMVKTVTFEWLPWAKQGG